ncbi:MAG: acyl carrier protein [Bacteroidales bacterium]|nr:acyl carrier protein [Bacteroidales bacterium]
MERQDIFEKLNVIFKEVLDLEESPILTDASSSNDFEEWDSLAQIQLIVAIEKEFNIKFTAKEIMLWKTVGEMVNSIQPKLNQ